MTEILSLIGGALVGWIVASYFYRRSSQDLKYETSELRRLTTLVLRGLENAGLVKFNKDKQGKIIGLVIGLKARDVVSGAHITKPTIDKDKS